MWRPKGYRDKPLKGYVIKPSKTHCCFWHDKERKRFAGCFPLHWFRDFELMTAQPSSQVIEGQPIALLERPDGQLTFF
ncbi:sugar ABC transporter [Bacillus toyonensis]